MKFISHQQALLITASKTHQGFVMSNLIWPFLVFWLSQPFSPALLLTVSSRTDHLSVP